MQLVILFGQQNFFSLDAVGNYYLVNKIFCLVGQMPPPLIMDLTFVEMTADMYSELREEARDHARLRNAYFEQVCVESLSTVFYFRKINNLGSICKQNFYTS